MQIIRPIQVTDPRLISSNIPETDYPEFSMGTTYGVGDYCIDTTGLETITLDVAPATAWNVGDLITGQTSTETAYVVLKVTTLTYQIRQRTGSFTLGEIIGVTGTPAKLADQGAAFPTITAATDKVHKVYESLSAGNLANYPALDVLEDEASRTWLEIGPTNRWKAFDAKVGSQSTYPSSITYQIAMAEIFDSVAFLNVDAALINIVFTDPIEGEVYNKDINLLTTAVIGTTSVIDWYTYFFGSFMKKTDVVSLDIPPYLNGVLDITISTTALTDVSIGAIVFGLKTFIGATLNEPSVGVINFSSKTQDAFGNYDITIREKSKRVSCKLKILTYAVDDVKGILTYYLDYPLVWIGDENFSSLIIYGFSKEFEVVLNSRNNGSYSNYSLEIEGLT